MRIHCVCCGASQASKVHQIKEGGGPPGSLREWAPDAKPCHTDTREKCSKDVKGKQVTFVFFFLSSFFFSVSCVNRKINQKGLS